VLKQLEEVQKKMAPLFTKLAKNEFSPDVLAILLQLSQSFLGNDHQTSNEVLNVSIKKHFAELGSSPIVGLKTLNRILGGS